MEEGTCKM